MRFMLRCVLAGAAATAAVLALSPAPATAAPRLIVLHGVGAPNAAGAGGAYSYDAERVPSSARVAVLSVSGPRRTRTFLVVHGLQPGQAYGAHLHTNACGASPAAAGPHYQQVPDPVQPSTDPAFANPENEVWLDVHTDAAGSGMSRSFNRWVFHTPPRSLVLHAEHTHTEPGKAGTAGARLACLDLN
jgi:Cu-Zn family superoxide dismutase